MLFSLFPSLLYYILHARVFSFLFSAITIPRRRCLLPQRAHYPTTIVVLHRAIRRQSRILSRVLRFLFLYPFFLLDNEYHRAPYTRVHETCHDVFVDGRRSRRHTPRRADDPHHDGRASLAHATSYVINIRFGYTHGRGFFFFFLCFVFFGFHDESYDNELCVLP